MSLLFVCVVPLLRHSCLIVYTSCVCCCSVCAFCGVCDVVVMLVGVFVCCCVWFRRKAIGTSFSRVLFVNTVG